MGAGGRKASNSIMEEVALDEMKSVAGSTCERRKKIIMPDHTLMSAHTHPSPTPSPPHPDAHEHLRCQEKRI